MQDIKDSAKRINEKAGEDIFKLDPEEERLLDERHEKEMALQKNETEEQTRERMIASILSHFR